jgi:anthranilate phosphoribosyltransferase
MKEFLDKVKLGGDLTKSESEEVFSNIIDGKYEDKEIAGFLESLAKKGESGIEISSLVKILKSKAVTIKTTNEDIIDICGTGGDNKNTLNISTASAFLVSACGLKVAKHGNRAVSSKSGSSDVLTALGININAEISKVEESLEKNNLTFLFAPNHHPVLKTIAPIRKKLGIRTIFNFVGPLLNPANTKSQLIGVADKKYLNSYIEAVKNLDFEKVILVNAEIGLDEACLSGKTNIIEIIGDEVKKYQISAQDFGIDEYPLDEIKGKDASYNAEKIIEIFSGKQNAFYWTVILNSAISLSLSLKYAKITENIRLCKNAIDNGLARKQIDKVKLTLN